MFHLLSRVQFCGVNKLSLRIPVSTHSIFFRSLSAPNKKIFQPQSTQEELDLQFDPDQPDPQYDDIEDDLRIDPTKGINEQDEEDRYQPTLKEKDITHPEYLRWKKASQDEARRNARFITRHSAIYRDASHDIEGISLYLRGDQVCLKIDDVWEWRGDDFQVLSLPPSTPVHAIVAEDCQLFETHHSYLTNFSLSFDLPLKLQNVQTQESRSAHLKVNLEVDHRHVDPQQYQLTLLLSPQIQYKSAIMDSMHNCLQNLVHQLPEHIEIKSCWSCCYSTFTPLGTSFFGGLGCFKGNEKMKNRTDVRGIFQGWAKRDRYVQENHLCSQWEARKVPHLMPKKNEFKKNRFRFEFEPDPDAVPSPPKRTETAERH